MSVVLSEYLPLLATAPDGIQKLRGLILELAVRGKLVPQDPLDEPASKLLKRIAKERALLESEGVCKKSKSTPDTEGDAKPFDVPAGWQWVRLAEIGHDWGQKTPDADFTYVDVSAIDNTKGAIKSPTVLAPDDAPSRARKIVRLGTVIYSTIRPYLLNIAVIDRELMPTPIASTAFAVIHPLAELSSQYIFWYLRSPVFIRYVESVQMGIAYPAINDSQFFSGFFPLPPLSEQHRIVAKVDELLALCDRLEAEQTNATSAHAKLVETLLGTLTQSRDADELAANWQRLSLHFDTLFSTETSLDALKQSILQLAVMGKLVPQDAEDEPASELLKRVATEKAQLGAEGTSKKTKPAPLVGDDEIAFPIPSTWNWVRLGALTELITKGSSPKWQGVEYVSTGKGVLFVTSENVGNYVLRKLDALKYVDPRFNEIEPRSILRYGDILINLVGASIGRTARFNLAAVANINQAVALVRLINGESIDSNYLLHFLNSDFAINHMQSSQVVNAQPNISLTDVRDFPVPFPPLAEQHRIVAKVDELIALCDRLKADLAEARTRQARLSTTLIEAALQAA